MTSNPPRSFLPFENFTEGLTPEKLPQFREFVLSILKDPALIYDQQRASLALAATRTLPYPAVSELSQSYIARQIIDLIGEGGAPYYPRYVAPNYEKLLRDGSSFLELSPALDLHDATATLLTAYQYMPNGQLPVFIGHLDTLLEPYVDSVPQETAYKILKSFWKLVDRLNPSGFVHANIGPTYTRVGQMLLQIDRELKTITNLSFCYDPDLTPNAYAMEAVRNTLELAKPYFVNHREMVRDWGSDYCIASCINGMPLRGGIHTLIRLNLYELVRQCSNGTADDVLSRTIPEAARLMVEIINSRVRFLVEEIRWYENNYWVKEGLLDPDRFTSYAGIFGLNEAVSHILGPNKRFGHDEEANLFAKTMVVRLEEELTKIPAVYPKVWKGGCVVLHAQVGINSDGNLTPGTRVPRGHEPPDVCQHISAEAPTHPHIAGGCSTIVEFEQTAAANPSAVLDIARGAMELGTRVLAMSCIGTEFVRVTGYLVRKSDLERYKHAQANRHSTAELAAGFFTNHPESLHHRQKFE